MNPSYLAKKRILMFMNVQVKVHLTTSSYIYKGTKKNLILREIPEDRIESLLIHKDALAACDIAVFVYDSLDKRSWLRATELLVQVASHGESTGYKVPCLIVAAKDDLEPYLSAMQDSTWVSEDMGVEAPIHISTKLGDLNDVFRRIVRVAEHPHLSIPKTEAGKTQKQYHRLFKHLPNGCFSCSCIPCLCYKEERLVFKEPTMTCFDAVTTFRSVLWFCTFLTYMGFLRISFLFG
uniref:mitochondrial Rho GTPase 1-like n=1 Tax=Erigeron canadensis TaxID=72917 RepID=UPI001CB9A364|nr:mitochondrial Rho GTPase 1-like [Erigeron canadensis]